MSDQEIEKALCLNISEKIDYSPKSMRCQTIIKKNTGNITAMSFDAGEGLKKKTLPFDIFAHVIDGAAEILIDDVSYCLENGQSIVIPAHSSHEFKANERFKMIVSIIKSGYE
ncbi:MAG: cupin domain-containing protein [Ignavibacteria bacterium]